MSTCKYVHTSLHELAEAQWKYSVVTVAHKNNSERRSKRYEERQAWCARDATARAIPFICSEFILYLLTACGNRSLLFVMQWEASLRGPPFISRPLLLSHLTDGGAAPSHRFTSPDWTPCFVLGVGSGYSLEVGREKYNENIGTGAKTLWRDRREHKHVTGAAKKPGPR